MNTNFQKKIISKNPNGSAADYQLYIKTEFNINYNDTYQRTYFEEKFNIKNSSDSVDQKNYENVIKNNFASSIRQKLILKLLSLK